jgi:hypothetical protein
VSWLTYKSLLPGNSFIRAEQEPDPNTLDFCGLPKTDSKSQANDIQYTCRQSLH